MPRFVVVTTLACRSDAAFDASVDVDLHAASMAASGERAVAGVTSGSIGLGESVTWQARHFGVMWRMTSRVTEYDRPRHFVDEQVRGPFRRWRHEHLFRDTPTGCVMTDAVEFAAPAGPLGWLVAVAALRPYLRRLIRRRNAHMMAALAAPE